MLYILHNLTPTPQTKIQLPTLFFETICFFDHAINIKLVDPTLKNIELQKRVDHQKKIENSLLSHIQLRVGKLPNVDPRVVIFCFRRHSAPSTRIVVVVTLRPRLTQLGTGLPLHELAKSLLTYAEYARVLDSVCAEIRDVRYYVRGTLLKNTLNLRINQRKNLGFTNRYNNI